MFGRGCRSAEDLLLPGGLPRIRVDHIEARRAQRHEQHLAVRRVQRLLRRPPNDPFSRTPDPESFASVRRERILHGMETAALVD